MLLVRRIRVFGDDPLSHFARERSLVVRAVAIQPLPRLRHQTVDRRTGHEIREGRILKLANGDIGQVHWSVLGDQAELADVREYAALPLADASALEHGADDADIRSEAARFQTKCTLCTLFFEAGSPSFQTN